MATTDLGYSNPPPSVGGAYLWGVSKTTPVSPIATVIPTIANAALQPAPAITVPTAYELYI